MSGFTSIDLSKLPKPDVIKQVDYEALFSEMKTEAIAHLPELAPFLELESEPVTKLLRVCAYHRMLDRVEFNDGARANMLAFSTGADLDGLAAFWGVERLIVQAADDSVSPPIAEIKEDNAAFRARVQLSLEGHTTAGPRGSYLFWTLSASGEVKDAAVDSLSPGEVTVTVLAHGEGDGAPSSELLTAVETALNDEDVRPLCDTVIVQAVTVLPFEVEAELTLYDGPGEAQVLEAAETALAEYLAQHHRIGHDITLSGLYAALHQPGVQKVTLTKPAADIIVGPAEVGFCPNGDLTVTVGGRDV